MDERARSRVWDWGFSAAALLLAWGLCQAFSAGRIFWSDELFGWMLVADPSFRHMLASWQAGADGGGPLFYPLARGWFASFGPSELSFRMFSATGIAGGALAVWFAVRRSYPRSLLAAMLLAVSFGTAAVLVHLVEGRFYGLLLGAVGLAYLAAVRAYSGEESGRPAWWVLFGANLLLAGSHPLGVVYSEAIVAPIVLVDLLEGRWRWRLLLAPQLAVAVVLAVSGRALQATAAVGRPHFWTKRPEWEELVPQLRLHSELVQDLWLGGAALLALVLLLRWLRPAEVWAGWRARRWVLAPMVGVGLVPLLIFLKSLGGTSLFAERYLVPFGLATAVGLTELWAVSLNAGRLPRVCRWVLGTGVAAAAALGTVGMWRPFQQELLLPPRDVVRPMAALLPVGVPVVQLRADVADMLWAYAPERRGQVVYVLDWETAMAPESPLGDVSGYHEMENWRRVGYFAGQIVDGAEFLQRTERFVVMESGGEQWFARRILADPGRWRVRPLAYFDAGGTAGQQTFWNQKIWLVERRQAGSSR